MAKKFRQHIPKRTCNKKLKSYKSYRPYLQSDFRDRCGYCDTPRFETMENFHIDHFAPREKFKTSKWKNKLDDYSNLVYSCPHCNLQKSDTWVTNTFTQSHNGSKGFLCPCDPAYDKLFKRSDEGEIIPVGPLANFIYEELKYYLKRFSIIWKMERINRNIILLQEVDDPDIKSALAEVALEYLKLLNEFRAIKKIEIDLDIDL